MGWSFIIALIVIGWILLFLEIFFIPGIAILAITGVAMIVWGVYTSFVQYGHNAGLYTLVATFAGIFVSLFVASKSGLWIKLGLKDTQRGAKMNLIDENKIKAGDVGKAQSKVAPIGTGFFSGHEFEVQSMGEYIEPQTPIEVIKIMNNKIYVKTKPE